MNLTKKRWVTLIACCLINLCLGSIYVWSVFASSMAEFLSARNGVTLTTADLAIVYTIANSVGPITLITGGWFNDKFGPKKVILVGGIMFIGLAAAGYFGPSAMRNIYMTDGAYARAFLIAAACGAAVTMSELVVHPETDGSHMLHLDLATVGSLAAFTFTADAIKRHGAVPSVEFSHSGQYAGTYMADKNKKQGLTQYGPSDGVRPDGMKVTALTKEQIADIVKRYADTAILAKRAGFEMIMIHGGHTWLLNQFISPFFNHRTDEYGGSFENRMRFTIEVLQAVREAVEPMFPIEFRMSGSELFDGGYDLDEGVRIAQAVEEYVDLIHVSAGSYQFGFFKTHPSMFSEHGMNVYLAEEIKKHVKKPVATIGALNDPEQMEEIIASGKSLRKESKVVQTKKQY